MEDDVLDELSKIGYRGVPHRESLKNRPSLIKYVFCINFIMVNWLNSKQ